MKNKLAKLIFGFYRRRSIYLYLYPIMNLYYMKKLFVIVCYVVLTCFYLSTDAQVDESKSFVYFSSDSVLYATNVRLRTKFLGSLRLEANGERIPLQDVSFINTDEGLFANIRKSGKAEFSERV